MSSRTQYIVLETLISVGINMALSIGFVFLVFHGQSHIPASGPHGIVFDMAPQAFMISLMSCLIPALLTRGRLSAGKLRWNEQTTQSVVAHIWLRAVILALLATCFVVAVSWAILPNLFPGGVRFGSLAVGKALFGMFLAAILTPWAIARVLH